MPTFKDEAAKMFYSNIMDTAETAGSVTVRFHRFTRWGITAYQAGQYAGFSREEADEIVGKGLGRLAP